MQISLVCVINVASLLIDFDLPETGKIFVPKSSFDMNVLILLPVIYDRT